MNCFGNQLEDLCTTAEREVTLVAPFMKARVLQKLLFAIGQNVELNCVTRWRPDEILAGVSDLEIWPLIEKRAKSSLWLRTDLHAKFYRIDGQCLVGSANLTSSALGWSKLPNLEILVQLPASEPSLQFFEANLYAAAIQVDNSIFTQVSYAVRQLKENSPTQSFCDVTDDTLEVNSFVPDISIDRWLPSLRNPEDLYLAYSRQSENLSTIAFINAMKDLSILSVPLGLSEKNFNLFIETALLQMPIIHKIDSFLLDPQRFGAVKRFLSSLPCASNPGFDADRSWQTLMRWLLYFCPQRYKYSMPKYSEVICRTDNQ